MHVSPDRVRNSVDAFVERVTDALFGVRERKSHGVISRTVTRWGGHWWLEGLSALRGRRRVLYFKLVRRNRVFPFNSTYEYPLTGHDVAVLESLVAKRHVDQVRESYRMLDCRQSAGKWTRVDLIASHGVGGGPHVRATMHTFPMPKTVLDFALDDEGFAVLRAMASGWGHGS